MHAATSKVENSAQGSSCQLKFSGKITDTQPHHQGFDSSRKWQKSLTNHRCLSQQTKNDYMSSDEGKSAASFCWQVTALVPAMFCNFYVVKKSQNCQ
jgi:hypothetical protein